MDRPRGRAKGGLQKCDVGAGPRHALVVGFDAATFTSGLLHTRGISPPRGRRLPLARTQRWARAHRCHRRYRHPAPQMPSCCRGGDRSMRRRWNAGIDSQNYFLRAPLEALFSACVGQREACWRQLSRHGSGLASDSDRPLDWNAQRAWALSVFDGTSVRMSDCPSAHEIGSRSDIHAC